MRLSTLLLFTASTILVLVPTPLIEPRYFLTPFLILRLYLARPLVTPDSPKRKSSRRARLFLEAVLHLVVQATCVWLFLEKTFEWDVKVGADGKGLEGRDEREAGKRQRFMW
jgi:alpha-1,2-glucosyltransferase